jgi:hypothetical protein
MRSTRVDAWVATTLLPCRSGLRKPLHWRGYGAGRNVLQAGPQRRGGLGSRRRALLQWAPLLQTKSPLRRWEAMRKHEAEALRVEHCPAPPQSRSSRARSRSRRGRRAGDVGLVDYPGGGKRRSIASPNQGPLRSESDQTAPAAPK